MKCGFAPVVVSSQQHRRRANGGSVRGGRLVQKREDKGERHERKRDGRDEGDLDRIVGLRLRHAQHQARAEDIGDRCLSLFVRLWEEDHGRGESEMRSRRG